MGHPEGLPNLSAAQALKVKLGNSLAEIAAALVAAQHAAGNMVQLEQPGKSLMCRFEPIRKALTETGARGYQRNACADGAPWMKPLVLYTPSHSVGHTLAAQCPGCKSHIPLRGKDPQGVDWTKVACAYWPAWAAAVARRWKPAVVRHERKSGWESSSPVMIAPGGSSHIEVLNGANYTPSGGRSLEKTSDYLSTGIQPTRKALPQLLPDGMPPHLQLRAALKVKHPMAYEPAGASVNYAHRYALDDMEETNVKRGVVCKLLRKLAEACAKENEELLQMCSTSVATVLRAFGTKNVDLMREIAYICNARDIASPAYLLTGLPMLG